MRLSGIGPVDENAVGTMAAGVELEFEHDSDWSGLGEEGDGEDPDSNSEGYYGNDYPEVMRAHNGMTRMHRLVVACLFTGVVIFRISRRLGNANA